MKHCCGCQEGTNTIRAWNGNSYGNTHTHTQGEILPGVILELLPAVTAFVTSPLHLFSQRMSNKSIMNTHLRSQPGKQRDVEVKTRKWRKGKMRHGLIEMSRCGSSGRLAPSGDKEAGAEAPHLALWDNAVLMLGPRRELDKMIS